MDGLPIPRLSNSLISEASVYLAGGLVECIVYSILFEITTLGPKFALTRFLINNPGIKIIATILTKIVPQDEINEIYKNAQESI